MAIVKLADVHALPPTITKFGHRVAVLREANGIRTATSWQGVRPSSDLPPIERPLIKAQRCVDLWQDPTERSTRSRQWRGEFPGRPWYHWKTDTTKDRAGSLAGCADAPGPTKALSPQWTTDNAQCTMLLYAHKCCCGCSAMDRSTITLP
jgi:hypothetical protein